MPGASYLPLSERLPTGTKRAAETSCTDRNAKVMKPSTSSSKGNGGAASPKTNECLMLPPSEFNKKALPLHVNITHTPPSLPKDETELVVPDDVGFIGTLTIVPSTFSTGSCGWKGNKKITVELLDPLGGDKTSVDVMLSVNATVIGSKKDTENSEEMIGEIDGGVGGYESDNDDSK